MTDVKRALARTLLRANDVQRSLSGYANRTLTRAAARLTSVPLRDSVTGTGFPQGSKIVGTATLYRATETPDGHFEVNYRTAEQEQS